MAKTEIHWHRCRRCQRETLHARREGHLICSACEPAVFERAMLLAPAASAAAESAS